MTLYFASRAVQEDPQLGLMLLIVVAGLSLGGLMICTLELFMNWWRK